MEITKGCLAHLIETYGDAFYLLDSVQFEKNYKELKDAFTSIYPNTNIAYSYKTNYTPKLCKIVDSKAGFAEVVSDMELELAYRIGVKPERIIWNGPVKNLNKVKELLLQGGVVNIDSAYEMNYIRQLAEEHPSCTLNVGIRCNFDIHDGVVSRFGIDTKSRLFEDALKLIGDIKRMVVKVLIYL